MCRFRSWLAVVLGAMALGCGGFAFAQAYPTKPIRVIVGFPAGGSIDIAARIIAPKLAERLGQPVLVINRLGAGGNIAVDAVAKAEPDGYTIGIGNSGALTINVTLQSSLPYDPRKDLVAIGLVATNPLLLAAHPSFEAKELRDLIALAKSKPRSIHIGSGGNGTAMHLAGAMLNLSAGIELTHIPYKGLGPAVNALLAGEIPLAVLDVATARTHMRSGRIKVIGVASSTRAQMAPEIPTLDEGGLRGFVVPSWFGLIGPARLPEQIVSRLNTELNLVVAEPEFRERLHGAGLEPATSTPEAFRTMIAEQIDAWAKEIKKAGIQIQ